MLREPPRARATTASTGRRGAGALQTQVTDSMKRFEYDLRRKVDGTDAQLLLSGSDEVPEKFRKSVEQYYRSLSKAPDAAKAGGREAAGEEAVADSAMDTCQCAVSSPPASSLADAGRRCVAQDYFQFQRRFRQRAEIRDRRQLRRLASTSAACIYQRPQRDGGQGWCTDYPDADINFSIRLSELTKTRVSQDPDGSPNHLVVRPTDPRAVPVPVRHASRTRAPRRFTDAEVAGLRAYLLKGGFLWVDDFWGPLALGSVRGRDRTRPARNDSIRSSTSRPTIRSSGCCSSSTEVPQIPSINHWRRSGGETSERGRRQRARRHARRSPTSTAASWC